MLWEIDIALDEKEYLKDLMPLDQMWSFHLSFGQLASGQGAQPFVTPQDYRNWLVRVEGYLAWMQSAEDNMREGMEKDWVLPTTLIQKVIPQLAQMVTDTPEEHLFYAPIKNIPESFGEADKEKLYHCLYYYDPRSSYTGLSSFTRFLWQGNIWPQVEKVVVLTL